MPRSFPGTQERKEINHGSSLEGLIIKWVRSLYEQIIWIQSARRGGSHIPRIISKQKRRKSVTHMEDVLREVKHFDWVLRAKQDFLRWIKGQRHSRKRGQCEQGMKAGNRWVHWGDRKSASLQILLLLRWSNRGQTYPPAWKKTNTQTKYIKHGFQETRHPVMCSDLWEMETNEICFKISLAYCLETVTRLWCRKGETQEEPSRLSELRTQC